MKKRSNLVLATAFALLHLPWGQVEASPICDPGLQSSTACAAGALQLASNFPGLPGAQSQLIGTSTLLGSGYVGPGHDPYPRGTQCPNMVICAGTGETDHAYREINIDSGDLVRVSELRFLLEPGQVQTLDAAMVQSLALVSVKFENAQAPEFNHQVALHLEPGPFKTGMPPRAIWLRAVRSDANDVMLDSSVPVVLEEMETVLVKIHGSPNGTSHFSISVGAHVLYSVDSSASMYFGRPTLLRYGNLGVVSTGQRPESALALVAGDWVVQVGDLVDAGRR